ncbi:putative lipase NDAI_0D00340 [Naumovozyma dairenensis CBS 421]|uniref:triacylglycerol lipase n=1 Tax=Naumovozyma dairenensis (strain ATCC 10597 / BCRC 20456 / CBS 421 / NBRC 0211 / NRRL Y-12639) TaxID=1071378 RepID=G0W987_NAUDC|nr:hypothetical protein NDAI_0D00340 [Naumovozyma dairenensis CBS 421]CCD24348.1 hypothetical protein NDAI_0D00340 [Naumovozyma dairenensis CBS 421]
MFAFTSKKSFVITLLITLFQFCSSSKMKPDLIPSSDFQDTNSVSSRQQYQANSKKIVKITNPTYERLVYFSKMSGMTSCITQDTIIPGKTLNQGGCPSTIRFCYDPLLNPTCSDTWIAAVLTAESGELGTGYVAIDHEKKVVICAFRSSTTIQDWFSDFEISPTKWNPVCVDEYKKMIERGIIKECKDCMIHRGFSKFSRTLGRFFLNKLENILRQYPDYHSIVTGHSLGAALASMAGIELRLRGYEPSVITYATPRLFNNEMKEWVDELFHSKELHDTYVSKGEMKLDKGYYRIIHTRDYIPMVPPFYEPAGLEIFIDKISLPHYIEDLSYIGLASEEASKQSIRDDLIEKVEEWLRTEEHRSYFINLAGCNGF